MPRTEARALLPLEDGIPTGECAACGREVVAYLLGDGAEGPVFACGRCDALLDEVRWLAEEELSRLGYEVRDPGARRGGCGCGSGGCRSQAAPSWRRPS